jgi:hypothetical protein
LKTSLTRTALNRAKKIDEKMVRRPENGRCSRRSPGPRGPGISYFFLFPDPPVPADFLFLLPDSRPEAAFYESGAGLKNAAKHTGAIPQQTPY